MKDLAFILANMEVRTFAIWVGVGGLIAVIALVLGFVQLARARVLEYTPRSLIRSAAQGYVELQGLTGMLPGPEIFSPLSATRCCWWNYRIEQRQTRRTSNGTRREWKTIEKASSDDLFLLEDDTGKCVVDPVGAKIIPSVSRSWRGQSRRPGAAPDKAQVFAFGEYRYSEQMIRAGDWIYALGHFESQTASRLDNESVDVGMLLADWKKNRKELLARFDTDGDGEIDLKEWETARKEAIRKVRAEQVERSVHPDLHVLSKPRDRRPFILSTKDEKDLTRGMRWSGISGVVIGVAGGAGVTFALIARGIV